MEQYFGVRSFLDSVEQRLSPVVTQLRGILFSVDEEEIGDGTGDKDKHEPLSSASAPDACVSPSNSSSALAASRMTQSYHSDMKTASSPVFSSSSSSGVSAMQQLRKFMSVIGSSPPESSASLPSVSPRPDVNSNASNMSINNYSSSDLKRGKPQLHTTNSMPQPVLRNNNSYGEVRNHKNNASHTPSSDSCRNSWPATTRLPHQQLQPSNGIKKILDARFERPPDQSPPLTSSSFDHEKLANHASTSSFSSNQTTASATFKLPPRAQSIPRQRSLLSNTHSLSVESSDAHSAGNSPFIVRRSFEADLTGGQGASSASETDLYNASYDDGLPADGSGSGSEKLGRIQFSLSYDFHEMTLLLKVIRAVELAAKDYSGTSDPYVRILLLPDKKTKLQTSIKRKNLNPRWNELFAFEKFPYQKLMTRTLHLQVLDYDRFSRDDPIGEVFLPLCDLDLTVQQVLWRPLVACKGHAGRLGELQCALCYQPSTAKISLTVMRARNLKSKDINGYSDPYVKVWLMNDGRRVDKKKTTVKEKDLNPEFNETFEFDVPYERIRQTSLLVSVMDHDRLGRNEMIGSLLLGSRSGPMEQRHWNEMFARTRQAVTRWHLLKDLS